MDIRADDYQSRSQIELREISNAAEFAALPWANDQRVFRLTNPPMEFKIGDELRCILHQLTITFTRFETPQGGSAMKIRMVADSSPGAFWSDGIVDMDVMGNSGEILFSLHWDHFIFHCGEPHRIDHKSFPDQNDVLHAIAPVQRVTVTASNGWRC